MFYIVNPTGRIVEVEDEEEYGRLLKKGFRDASTQEIEQYDKMRKREFVKMTSSEVENPDVYFTSVSPGSNGYGVASKKIKEGLTELGVKWSEYQKGQKVGFVFDLPYSVTRVSNPIKILYTMFDSSRIPDDFKEYLDAVDLILVPSHWCMEVFAQSGYTTKVVPLGYDDRVFRFIDRPVKAPAGEPFTFLHYDAFNLRKGFLEVLKAFLIAFKPTENVKMVFKTVKEQPNFPLPPSQYPHIEVITGSMSEEGLINLMAQSDCFVFPSRGEGFGITPLEAMGTGLPAIIPNAHGISEYFNSECMYEVKIEKKSPAIYMKRLRDQNVGYMLESDIQDLARQMRYVYEHREEAKYKGRLASEYVKKFTFTKTAVLLKEIIDEQLARTDIAEKKSNILPLEAV